MKSKVNQVASLLLFLLFFSVNSNAQTKENKTNAEIQNVLKKWNDAAKKANLEEFMSLYDDNPNAVLVGSAKGEIFIGKAQIKSWLTQLFKNNTFQWEMNKIHIDSSQNTAWTFVDGAMIVTNKEGKEFRTPYRFTGILVKKNKDWKWRLFNGSVPESE